MIATKASQIGMHVIVNDPYLKVSRARALGIEPVSFDALLARSDFISLHAPLNDETRHIFGESAFRKMKNTASIVNTARGGLIDEDALVTALNRGEISGAALDVMESETATAARAALVNNLRVILTPHSAWLSEEARSTLQARAVEQVISCLKGNKPYGLINRTVRPREFRGS
jgi:D-3-phosphoglycerate dehydrogenase